MAEMSSIDPAVTPSTRRFRSNRSSVLSGHIRQRVADPPVGLNPVAGVTQALLPRASRRIETRWTETADGPADLAAIAPILAAAALAVDRGDASCIDALARRPSLRLTTQLVDLLDDERRTLWRSGEWSSVRALSPFDRW